MPGKKANRPMQVTGQQVTAIDPAITPYRDDVLSGAQDLWESGANQQFPTFDTWAGLGDESRGALQSIIGRGSAGGALTGQASTALSGILSGDQNPFLEQMVANGSEDIANQVKAAYAAKGRYGSEDFTDALTSGIGKYQLNTRGAAYESDASRRLQAIGLAPGLDDAAYAGDERSLQAGLLLDADRQGQTDADVERWMFEHGGGAQGALEDYAGIVSGVPGGSTTTLSEPQKTLLQKLMAGLTGGLGILGALR